VPGGELDEWQQRTEGRIHTTLLGMLLLIFPAMYVIILGPTIPAIVGTFGGP